VAAVVKADAYGMGAAAVAPALAEAGCDSFSSRGWKKASRCASCAQARIFVLDGAHPDSGAALDPLSPDAGAEQPGADRRLVGGGVGARTWTRCCMSIPG
jgi:hypothetical protein